MSFPRTLAVLALLPAAALAQQKELPLKHTPEPTKAAITASDLMTRLYIFSDDSMQGRQTGTPGFVKGTAYIEAEVRKMGLKPAGDNGGFFQNVPVVQRWVDASSSITAGGVTLVYAKDFVAGGGRGEPRPIDGAAVIFGGVQGDTVNPLTADQVRGKLVVLVAAAGGGRGGRGGAAAFGGRGGGAGAALAEAAGIATIVGEQLPAQLAVSGPPRAGQGMTFTGAGTPAVPTSATLSITSKAAEALLGVPVAQATKGMAGKTIKATLKMNEQAVPARNIVAILDGSDPKLKNTYVAIGAHNDHIGMRAGPGADHDSLHLYNEARYAITGMLSRGQQATPEQLEAVRNIKINMDSVRKLRPSRADTVSNGADDDGSGTVSVLEIAERFAKLPAAQRPKRSLLFVWHVGEENGLWGSQYVTDHPPVPRD